ncbi:E3 ubiquitin-protein ligase RNF14 [Amphibalanus amphitrite]|uniref:RBR-type E3 ubiquitin transferase n=2 Tax=Amphibalanus amphitrite TaxID=1232801 RepID=A0A6A4WG12_AMPAM|nr:E3 ubiquitin-protein ligase RNF14-like isoform X2 [Amphibalanus amphitrite]XP_043242458.1 E3 ubiquitin-protein ligase RNF14-like isoform X2 [Amphibalanus amphitrite]XP_043242459.1 E3 ubiquitin-protein ligase RNF14-like isoform X2 [Amphibalanus amphitrite]KAF0304169.1 E3 ubiquitin-protein ligase RNF14 [Amphibalanus amphitrite]
MEDREQQREELLVMDSIFGHDGLFTSDDKQMSGMISVSPELQRPLLVKPPEPDKEPLSVSALPPICIEFTLPEQYPLEAPPTNRVTCSWLTPTQMLKIWRHLVTLWEQGQGNTVLYEYTEFLRNDSIAFLGLEHELDVSFFVDRARTAAAAAAAGPPSPAAGSSPPRSLNRRASVEQLRARYRLTLPASASVHRLLETHQRQAEAAEFGRRRFPCKVCGEERAGSDCVRLTRCGHVYCRDCLTAYYTVLIRDGEVQNLRCPEDQCPEQATPKEVRDLVGDDLFERYDTILLRTSLSAMTDVVTCPRAHCQKPVVLDPGDSLGRCAHCDHTFCAICQNAYHGNNPCAVKSGERLELVRQYRVAGAGERADLERRYGRRQLQRLVEEVDSAAWMSDHSERCPRCRTPIEKIDGCNKMSCTKCGTLFCWLCNARLPRENPYTHFNVPGSKCFNQLFAGVVDGALLDEELGALAFDELGEEEDLPMGFFL